MIDWNKTEIETGKSKEYFDKFPNSDKKVYRICDNCKNGKWLSPRMCTKLCHKCACNIIEYCKNQSESHKGKILTNEHKEKIGLSNKGKIRSKEQNQKQSERMLGYKHTKKSKIKMSKSRIGKPIHSKEYLEKLSKLISGGNHPFYGKHHSDESKKKISCTLQGISLDDFSGFTDKSRPHLIPLSNCIKLNKKFKGSEGHHIMSGVVIFMPKDLHQSQYHELKNNKGMKEINKLAFNYLIGDI